MYRFKFYLFNNKLSYQTRIYSRRIADKDAFTASLRKRVLSYMYIYTHMCMNIYILCMSTNMNNIYLYIHRIYSRRIADKDAFTASLWKRVLAHIQLGLSSTDLQALEKIRVSDHALLEKVYIYIYIFICIYIYINIYIYI
jgi:hypothetical protein